MNTVTQATAQTYNGPMRILIANDDGYLAPGLAALVRAIEGLGEIGLDRALFAADIAGAAVQSQLQDEIMLARRAPIHGFPSLVVATAAAMHPLVLDYLDAAPMLQQIAGLKID